MGEENDRGMDRIDRVDYVLEEIVVTPGEEQNRQPDGRQNAESVNQEISSDSENKKKMKCSDRANARNRKR